MPTHDRALEAKLLNFSRALIDQEKARVIVPPERAESGYWFGGGNLAMDPEGTLWLTGRYRSAGDSRTGLDLGDRGRELAIFRSLDRGRSWKKVLGLGKEDLRASGREVLSIEGSALRFRDGQVELFVSSEKRLPYPEPVSAFMKPGTGVWTIERMVASSVEGLAGSGIETVLESHDPGTLHVKDPFLYDSPSGTSFLFFCHHPFIWSSSNSGFAVLDGSTVGSPDFSFLPRGRTWDVAISRATCILDLPRLGHLADTPPISLVFYDGGECLRRHDEHAAAAKRRRGHSCEELGGVGYFSGGDFAAVERLSPLFPAFESPWGSGSSRYVDVLHAAEGFYATWQQAQKDCSQALVMNFMPMDEALG
ncbi:MAG: hypothetical protein WCL50_16320, partial [Spirochaetota bacterium]